MKNHTHYAKKINKDYLIYCILLLILGIFGFYKNGLSYYFNQEICIKIVNKKIAKSFGNFFVLKLKIFQIHQNIRK